LILSLVLYPHRLVLQLDGVLGPWKGERKERRLFLRNVRGFFEIYEVRIAHF